MDIPHELQEEFPQEISLIERIIRTNYEFRRLAERYDEVNRNIYRIESEEEPTTDEVLARLKKWRGFAAGLRRQGSQKSGKATRRNNMAYKYNWARTSRVGLGAMNLD
jgi:uncharacterized protein YdcH (DUF465 family)